MYEIKMFLNLHKRSVFSCIILLCIFVINPSPYSIILHNFVGTICQSNMRFLNVLMISLDNIGMHYPPC